MNSHLVLFVSALFVQNSHSWNAVFNPDEYLQINMGSSVTVNLSLTGIGDFEKNFTDAEFHLETAQEGRHIVSVNKVINITDFSSDGTWNGDFVVFADFLGETDVFVRYVNQDISQEFLHVTVIREQRVLDTVFTVCVAVFVSIFNINFGAALDLGALKGILKKPVGPVIGFVGQFILMPLISYGLGYALFPSMPTLALGLFFTGVSPGGGASNMWTVLLKGNLNLSITMTAISTFAAFGMIPFWLFTLGKTIFDKSQLVVPYGNISTIAISLLIPLSLGILAQRFLPKVAKLLVRILKPLSGLLILFIVIFAIVANLYLFELFSWQILVAGLALPWLGYAFSWILATALRQNAADALTIALETGIQNTGIAIFLLRFSLPQPSADLTTVVPVAVAIMAPFPLLAIYIYQQISLWITSKGSKTVSRTEQLKDDA